MIYHYCYSFNDYSPAIAPRYHQVCFLRGVSLTCTCHCRAAALHWLTIRQQRRHYTTIGCVICASPRATSLIWLVYCTLRYLGRATNVSRIPSFESIILCLRPLRCVRLCIYCNYLYMRPAYPRYVFCPRHQCRGGL